MITGTDSVADGSRRSTGWAGILLGTSFVGAGAAVAAIEEAMRPDWDPSSFPIMGAFGAFFALVGMVGVIKGVRNVWLSHVLGTPTLTVPPAEPLLLGGVLVARFERRGGTGRVRQAPQLSAELVCAERVTYRQGTDTHTVTREICRSQLPMTADPAPGTVAGQIVVEVPTDAPPSLSLRNNRIIWTVLVHVRADGLPDDTGTFVVPVRPALAARVFEGGSSEGSGADPGSAAEPPR